MGRVKNEKDFILAAIYTDQFFGQDARALRKRGVWPVIGWSGACVFQGEVATVGMNPGVGFGRGELLVITMLGE